MLDVIDLKKTYTIQRMFDARKHAVKAVDGVSFSVKKGDITALVGESGSGKSTIARCIAGLEVPDAGKVLIDGAVPDYTVREKRRQVQYIFQDTLGSLNPRMRIKDALREPIVFHFGLEGSQLERAIDEAAEATGLPGQLLPKFPHELSGGQRQRVVIARALSMKPGLIIADEPVSSLDVSIQAQILKLFSDLNGTGTTMLFITHDLRIVRSLAEGVIVLKDGRVVESGPVDRVFDNPGTEYTRTLLAAIPSAGSSGRAG